MSALREEITGFLAKHGIRLNTDLGQHFLIDEDVLETIVESANVREGEQIVEIGPGIGVLTRALLRAKARVMAVEFDERLIPLLRQFADAKTHPLTIVAGNALHVPMPLNPYKIVANIPYHITSPLLRHVFLESNVVPSSLTLLIQKEVAETICDSESAGILTILVGLFGKASYVCSVAPSAFLPPPEVDSAVLHVECYEQPKADAAVIERIFTLTKVAFGQKRKMLRNTLGNLPNGMEILQETRVEPTRRPQTLTIEEWIALARRFAEVPERERTDRA